ncbi:LysM peptidoglycan-binding domain-containing protein [Carboxydothermus pertinax]|uniref:LysM domain-containing protein n=1 Tax=Carboxydothermus pertinax TaxID=870242 RepID=A0A1L8CRQ8_9THEO|nr:LysM peptidoglycan-binding domain-containing protein [Carboxydothermus pertinax]GAV21583.1 hypothetical protein cpu_00930 [Carboxydothermus pertinax]
MDREFKIVFFIMLLAAVIGAAARLPHIINYQAIVIDHANTQEIIVEKGDTLWGIAKELSIPGKDIRIVIEEIKILNNMDSYTIYPGQALKVPMSQNEIAKR